MPIYLLLEKYYWLFIVTYFETVIQKVLTLLYFQLGISLVHIIFVQFN